MTYQLRYIYPDGSKSTYVVWCGGTSFLEGLKAEGFIRTIEWKGVR